MNFQDIMLTLQNYWAKQGCVILQPYDMEMGAGTFHSATFLRCLGPASWRTAYVQPCRRPTDGRYGENPNRFQHYYQFQVILKPAPENSQELYLNSLRELGIDLVKHDVRFVEDDWESPTLGATGLGWEVWLDGMEITQFTYFQQMGTIELFPVSVELTYGLERIAMFIQKKANAFELEWVGGYSYGDIHYQDEVQFSRFNFEKADTEMHTSLFNSYEGEALHLLEADLVLPATDFLLKASHAFNILDARGAIGVNQRTEYITRIRRLARLCAEKYLEVSHGKEKGRKDGISKE